MKYYIIAGEASGDLHASNLVSELKKLDSNAEFRGFGGDLMINQGVQITKHIKELAFMGFIDVLFNIFKILKNFKICKQDILNFNPDVVILVDYPGFNLRIAKFIHKHGIKNFYYISPTVWAWHKSRVFTIKKYIDKLFVILPFEKEFYKNYNYHVDYVGNPIMDQIIKYHKNKIPENFRTKYNLSEKPIIAILPGSRKQELKRILPIMISIIPCFKEYQFVIAGVKNLESLYDELTNIHNCKIIFNDTYFLLENSQAAIVTSGTATLETALFNVPQVVCYKAGNLSFRIAKLLVKINFISLVNLILNKKAITELIQNELNTNNLKLEFQKILDNKNRISIFRNYEELRSLVGSEGASKTTSQLMYNYLTVK